MAEKIVEQVGLDQVVELGALADPHRHRKSPVREMIVEHRIGDKTRHANHLPPGQRLELGVHTIEVWNALADAQRLEALHELDAGELPGQRRLPLDQQPPYSLILSRIVIGLRDGPVRRHAGVVAAKASHGSEGFHVRNMGPDPRANPGEVGRPKCLF